VLAAGAEPRAYGAMLIDIASRTHRLPVAAAALADPPTDLERRILAMTTKLPRFRPLRAGAAVLCAAALVLVACDVDLLDPALRDATVGEVVNTAVLADSGMAAIAAQARYFVDGDEVALDEIRDLRVAEFAHVSVVQPTASATGTAEVRMTTAAAHAAAQAAEVRAVAAGETVQRGTAVRGVTVQRSTAVRGVTVERVASQRDTLRAVTVTGARRPIGQPVTTGVAVRGETRAVRIVPQSQALQAPRLLPQAEARRGLRIVPQAAALQSPLYVIDGVVVSAGAVNIGALDIESVEIIKGAAAAALYGTRAANGVIFITTKRH
jgi:TonB-dependent SusC/RagA subfamily outer membrane receptor